MAAYVAGWFIKAQGFTPELGLLAGAGMGGEAGEAPEVPDATAGISLAGATDGGIVRGTRGGAGEIGHIPVREEGPRCSCGNRGCLETFISEGCRKQNTKASRSEIFNRLATSFSGYFGVDQDTSRTAERQRFTVFD